MTKRRWLGLSAAVLGLLTAHAASADEAPARWKATAARVEIVRDDWGIAHVHGVTDADAVFGMIYAQAEDDFGRVEDNYLKALGRHAEALGESAVFEDLRERLFIDPADLKTKYAASPNWLKELMVAWADGLNYFLATHPAVKPHVITRFEPWMALSFSEGSIGGNIEKASLRTLKEFYDAPVEIEDNDRAPKEPGGSNGIAIAPANTVNHHALLLINPHTSFYFRSELQMTSDAGLDAYGAATWGQFFIYQGFNEHAGWMHTTSGADAVDEFLETIVQRDGKLFYRYGSELRPVQTSAVDISYRAADGSLKQRRFTTYKTVHGPIVRKAGNQWVALALMQKPVQALEQSFLRTKAVDYASFSKVAEHNANSSNNTLFADDKGEIALLLPQFIPKRDNRFDYTKPVDGADPVTAWHGESTFSETPHVVNPRSGWVANTNNWPYSSSGPDSPKIENFPRYMDQVGENPRGLHATRVLSGRTDFTLDGLLKAAFDSYLPAFAQLIPRLLADYDALPAGDPLREKLKDQIAVLRTWDDRWAADSVATTLAVYWGEALMATSKETGAAAYNDVAAKSTPAVKLGALAAATDKLEADFGAWRTPWGETNRFQRIDDAISQTFDDAKPSIPVPFTSSVWGSFASFGIKADTHTKKRYGSSGNSFVAVVEFGPRVRARAITAGGESGDPKSPHFSDQAERYVSGDFREVYFYPDQREGHTERRYHPGS